MIAAIEAQDAVVIIGACGALVVAILAPMLKALVDIRKSTSETNAAVNNRPKDQPSIRDLVERIDIDLDIQSRESTTRHDQNSRRIDRLYSIVEQQTRKSDRIMDALAAVNDRLDRVEGHEP